MRRAALFVCLLVAGALVAPASATSSAGPVWGPEVVEPEDFAISLARESGWARSWTTGDDVEVTLTTYPGRSSLRLGVRPAGELPYSVSFAAPRGERLVEGRYRDTARISTEDAGGLDVGFQGSGCNETTGEFEVHRFTEDLSSVWITWHVGCFGSLGEIRIGVPEPDAGLQLVPRLLDWGPRRVGTASGELPVRLRNTGERPVTVDRVVLDEGGAHYEVRAQQECERIAPGEECRVLVVHRPTGGADGARPGSVVIEEDDGTRHRVELRAQALAGHWRLDARDDDGVRYTAGPEHLGGYSWRPGSDIDLDNHGGAGESFDLRLVPPPGESFQAGRTYVGGNPLRDEDEGLAGFSLALSGQHCDGRAVFRIHEVEYDARERSDFISRLERLSLTFDRPCPDGDGVRGSISYHVDEPAPDPGPRHTLRLGRPRGAAGDPTSLPWAERARFAVSTGPARRGGCVTLQTQHHLEREWTPLRGTRCVRPDARGVAVLLAPTAELPRRARVRIRASWRTRTVIGPELTRTPWSYLRVASSRR